MKLVLALGSLVLVPWSSVRPQESPAPAAEARARVLDARTLEVVHGERRHELALADLPPGTRLHAVAAAPFLETGLVVALALELEQGFEYRFLMQREGDGGGARAVLGTPREFSDWELSGALHADVGAAYRIVEVHNPGGDTLELTLRRGVPHVQRDGAVGLDEILIVDECPGVHSAAGTGWVKRIRMSGRAL
jgi:hypothetical protein